MCLVVYLGTAREVKGFDEPAIGDVGLDPSPGRRPEALASKQCVYAVADRVKSGWNCSCIFLDHIMPWELERGYDPAHPATAVREAAYAGLRRIAAAALRVDPQALLFSTWSGGENDEPVIRRELVPGELVPARYLFDDVLDGGSGGNPPILIRLRAGARGR